MQIKQYRSLVEQQIQQDAQGTPYNRKQMFTYTGVVLAFLAFMVALVGLADFGLTKLVMLVFG